MQVEYFVGFLPRTKAVPNSFKLLHTQADMYLNLRRRGRENFKVPIGFGALRGPHLVI